METFVGITCLFLVIFNIIMLNNSFVNAQPIKVVTSVCFLSYFSLPTLNAFLAGTFWNQIDESWEFALKIIVFAFMCEFAYFIGYYFINKKAEISEAGFISFDLLHKRRWMFCYCLLIIGLLSVGATPKGIQTLWGQSWLESGGITGESQVGTAGRLGALGQAAYIIGILSIVWTRNLVQFLAISFPSVLAIAYTFASGGRSFIIPIIIAALLRFYVSRVWQSGLFNKVLARKSLKKRIIYISVLAGGIIIATMIISFIGFLREYRKGSFLETLVQKETYNEYKLHQESEMTLRLGDTVWIWAFRVPKDISIQPFRILKDLVAYMIPGFIIQLPRYPNIEHDLAQIYVPGSLKGSTIHASFVGIGYIMGGWFGFLWFFPIGLFLGWIEKQAKSSRGKYRQSFWFGILFIFCYWTVFAMRGALNFALFRSLYPIYLWIAMLLIMYSFDRKTKLFVRRI